MIRLRIPVLIVLAAGLLSSSSTRAQGLPFGLFDRYLETLRAQAGIPGLSAVIVQEGRVVWERAYGLRDVEAVHGAHPDTPYPIADLTQTFASVLLMQCVERGRAELDAEVGRWSPTASDTSASLRQLLSHATPGVPNWTYLYNPARFASIGPVVEVCGQKPARRNLTDSILGPLVMRDTIPGRDVIDTPSARRLFDDETLAQYDAVYRRMAVAYKVDRRGKATRNDYRSPDLTAATGLISSVRDLAKFDAALDDRFLLRDDTLAATWTNTVIDGVTLPTGLGWFTQTYEGQRLIWHFGYAPDAYSSLILKVPARRITLILLANSDGLSAPYALSEGDVTSSLFAQTFLRLFL